jgi:hypothetical protein
MLVLKQTHINMVELVGWAILLLAAAVALVIGVVTSDWLSGAPVYLPGPSIPLPFGFISALAMAF